MLLPCYFLGGPCYFMLLLCYFYVRRVDVGEGGGITGIRVDLFCDGVVVDAISVLLLAHPPPMPLPPTVFSSRGPKQQR